jgi:hypothetical protein
MTAAEAHNGRVMDSPEVVGRPSGSSDGPAEAGGEYLLAVAPT